MVLRGESQCTQFIAMKSAMNKTGMELHILLIEFKQEFDSVPRHKLGEEMRRMEIWEKIDQDYNREITNENSYN